MNFVLTRSLRSSGLGERTRSGNDSDPGRFRYGFGPLVAGGPV